MASSSSRERGGGIAFEEGVSSFTVLVLRKSQEGSKAAESNEDPRQRFWQGFTRGRSVGNGDEAQLSALERDLRSNFDRAMARQAFNFRRARAAETDDLSSPPPPANFAFRVGLLRYSSLEFTVGIVGLQALYKFFFSDPALVLAFLELCSPTAFAEAVQPFGGPIPSDLSYAVTPAAGLAASLSTLVGPTPGSAAGVLPAPTAQQGWAAVMGKVQSIWWLLPTLLALVVFYIAISAMHSERDRQQTRLAALDARAAQLDGVLKDRVKELESLNLELIKLLRQPPSKDTCCAACCPAPSCARPPSPPASRPAGATCK